MESIRQKQVGELIRRQFSTVLNSEGKYIYGYEPLVTITDVKMSPDLGLAKVYLSVFNQENKQEIILLLEDQVSKLRHALHSRISRQLRIMPDLRFYLDETLDEAYKLDQLFKKLHDEKQFGED
ncbi:MAG: 30S ribosome-binding factor RbfA [Saprospiraceae bacterium]|nr:30S ribosome-binding factor RbfA [Saprospiraceae bacterium]HMW40078.1 30S ribosome-binding factor RbfA [Saprospiraceae bacterium]HMX88658.1 30S ribosome-binding factor RbfA [Saprospiraceae bacterium]HMZ41279.1 30S ribosome-binding factor RbfA [Saprospiraceae bacterium]HNA65333.1 30S ribosome-binding factor RbfA [Saprospiraceae bacterium]